MESILFGHRRGAFSGADQDQPGLVRAARDGTLFLDELGDLPPPAQVALLRVLQDGEVLSVGETRPQRIDVRVVAALQRPLADVVQQGRLRSDLAARLAGLEVRLPALVERREDLGLLMSALLPKGARLTAEAARDLVRHEWPLNVRELEKVLAVAAALAGGEIRSEHLPKGMVTRRSESDAAAARLRAELVALLKDHHGNVAEVASIMGKSRMQIHRWVKRLGIAPKLFRQ